MSFGSFFSEGNEIRSERGVVGQGSTGERVTDGIGTDDLGVTEYYSNGRLLNIL